MEETERREESTLHMKLVVVTLHALIHSYAVKSERSEKTTKAFFTVTHFSGFPEPYIKILYMYSSFYYAITCHFLN